MHNDEEDKTEFFQSVGPAVKSKGNVAKTQMEEDKEESGEGDANTDVKEKHIQRINELAAYRKGPTSPGKRKMLALGFKPGPADVICARGEYAIR